MLKIKTNNSHLDFAEMNVFTLLKQTSDHCKEIFFVTCERVLTVTVGLSSSSSCYKKWHTPSRFLLFEVPKSKILIMFPIKCLCIWGRVCVNACACMFNVSIGKQLECHSASPSSDVTKTRMRVMTLLTKTAHTHTELKRTRNFSSIFGSIQFE